uniref:Transposase n=1 Tax=Globodera rostochiensis TaxID=31243 RepID=A0A914H8P2_GLORO
MKDQLKQVKFEIKTEETQLDEVKIEAIVEDELPIQKTDSFEEECFEEEELNSNFQDDKILKKLKIYKKAKQSNPHLSDAYIAKTLFRINEHTLYNWKKKFGIQKKRHSPTDISKIMQLYVAMKERTSKINDDDFADEFGICRQTLFKWKNDFGLEKALTFHNDKEIQTILKNYHKIKSKCPDIRDYEIAKKFGIDSKTLLRWKKQCGYKSKQINSYKPDEKFEIIRQYKELIKGKDFALHDYELAKKLNIHRTTLMRWKSEFGLKSRKLYSDKDKNKILQKYYKLKKRQPELSETKIAKQLSVNRRSLKKWKTEFDNRQTFEHGNSGKDDAISSHDEETSEEDVLAQSNAHISEKETSEESSPEM